jgi:GNAT superfamily N-acetyltransferase
VPLTIGRLGVIMSLLEYIYSRAERDGIKVTADDRDEYVEIKTLLVDPSRRRTGLGSNYMRDVCAAADAHNVILGISPEAQPPGAGRAAQLKLESCYRRFGFIENEDEDRFAVTFVRFPPASSSSA